MAARRHLTASSLAVGAGVLLLVIAGWAAFATFTRQGLDCGSAFNPPNGILSMPVDASGCIHGRTSRRIATAILAPVGLALLVGGIWALRPTQRTPPDRRS